jgi:hydrogenase expression/formation protein HypD
MRRDGRAPAPGDVPLDREAAQLKFRDPARGRRLAEAMERLVRDIGRSSISIMHVCGSHEQAIARFGLRALLPPEMDVIMGPGCPVCVTDMPEVDEAVALALSGVRVATYGDMLKVPGTVKSLADARSEGARVDVVYSVTQAVDLARRTGEELVFFATGFETTAVATAAAVLGERPPGFSILSAHKYILPAMEVVADLPGTRIEGFLAAGHAATITGSDLFQDFVRRHRVPVVVAGFEPLDILAALVKALELIRDGRPEVANMFPRCVTPQGNRRALEQLWRVFETTGGHWRGIARIPDGNMRLREEWAEVDARRRFEIDVAGLWEEPPASLAGQCICGQIMSGLASPFDCLLYDGACIPEKPVGACMVSSEGACKIWHQYGGRPDLRDRSPAPPAPPQADGGAP